MLTLTVARRTVVGATLLAVAAVAAAAGTHAASAQGGPVLLRDVRTGTDLLGSRAQSTTPSDYIQPDTQIEPSIAVNPNDAMNAVTGYQEGRVDGGGDATNGFATTFDGGRTWSYGEAPGLTSYPGQGGPFDRASDAVVAFGPSNDVYYSSLVFDDTSNNDSPNGNAAIEGMRSGMAINVSKDGGRTWSAPVFFADDNLDGLNDKNWVVVDNSDAAGHHKGRVYVVWDRVANVYYDYCDSGCDQLSGWAFGGTFQQLDVIPAATSSAIGSTPVVLNSGALAVLFRNDGTVVSFNGALSGPTKPVTTPFLESVTAELAGSQPFGTPLAFSPPVPIAQDSTTNVRAQRAGSLPTADYDSKTGTLAIAWEDGRNHTETHPVNDILVSTSTDDGVTWSAPVKVNPSSATDYIDRYNPSIAGSGDGVLHIAYRTRREADTVAGFSTDAQTWYQESSDGGASWSAPLLVNTVPNNLYYGAFSRQGTFEGDYNGIASAKGYTYVARDEAYPAYAGEPPALSPDTSDSTNPDALQLSGKGHQHQQTWVAVVGPATTASTAVSQVQGTNTTQAQHAASAIPNTSPAAAAPSARVALLAGCVVLVAVAVGRRRQKRKSYSSA